VTDPPTTSLPARREPAQKLDSEQVHLHAPMSLTGAVERSWRLTSRTPKWGWGTIAILLIAVWWIAVVAWYLTFGLLLIPYRLVRRGQRKRKMEELRHRETMGAISQKDS
jgi:hypothetical protein